MVRVLGVAAVTALLSGCSALQPPLATDQTCRAKASQRAGADRALGLDVSLQRRSYAEAYRDCLDATDAYMT